MFSQARHLDDQNRRRDGSAKFMLEKLAVFYQREVEATVSSLTNGPAVIIVVAELSERLSSHFICQCSA